MIKKEEWDKLVIENGREFLQSWDWGEFQKTLGKRVERIKTDNFLAQIIFNPLPFGLNYGYVPRGPVVTGNSIKEADFWDKFDDIKDKGTVFFEVELSSSLNFLNPSSLSTRQPRVTSVVDLTRDTNILFSGFHKTLRYNIRLAEKRNVVFRKEKSWEDFFNLLSLTAKRQNFRVWPASYYKKLWQVMAPTGGLEIWSAYKDNELLSSNLFILFGSRITYLFGASNYDKRSLMAPHFLHWQLIQEFKKRGFTEYDFWGIDKDSWPGITLFKKRFGGKKKVYPGSYIKVFRPGWYNAYRIVRTIRPS